MNTQMRVIFYLRGNYKTSNGTTPIQVRVSFRNEHLAIGSTACYVVASQWDKNKERAKGRTPETMKINQRLDHIEADLMHIFRRHEFEENFSLDFVKAEYLGRDKEDTSEYFLAFFDEYINTIKEEVGIRRAYASVEKMGVIRKRFAAFIQKQYKRKDLKMGELTFKVISDFEHFLLTDSKCCHNTVMRMMRSFKTVTIRAMKMGLMKQDPFATYKIRFDKVDRGFLTDEEIQAIMGMKAVTARTEAVRDIFVFSIFTGLAYIDVANLTAKNIVNINGREWIMVHRQKTDVPTNIVLLDIPKKIIKKYREQMKDDPKGRLLPVISNQKMNSYLKEIGDRCGIQKNLSFHLARHTFATMALTKGVPVESVSKMLGHTNIQTTQIYARVISKKIESDMLQLSEKLDFSDEAI